MQNSVFILFYIYIYNHPLADFTNWIYFHLTSTVIKTQSQLTLAAEDMSNYAAFSSTVLLGFFPF